MSRGSEDTRALSGRRRLQDFAAPVAAGGRTPIVSANTELSNEQFLKVSRFVESELGIKMPPTKKVMLESRLQKRLRALGLGGFDEYLERVFGDDSDRTEMIHMVDVITTNKTDFFREPDHFDHLLGRLLPLEQQRTEWNAHRPFLAWSTACSSGEEPYTIAFTLEEFRRLRPEFEYEVLATDISSSMLSLGRNAVYSEERIAPIPDRMRHDYLLRSRDASKRIYRVRPELRHRVSFHRLNLMSDSFGITDQFDVIFCRNVMIYFDRANQERLLRKLHRQLQPGGHLFLGHSESLAGMDLSFTSVAPTVYRKPR